MKLSELLPILESWNDKWFKAIEGKLGIPLSTPPGSAASDAVRLGKIQPEDRCYCGDFNDVKLFPGEIAHSSTGDSLAVGAVLDGQSNTEADLPVVIAVGINYWQFGNTPAPWNSTAWRHTKIRPRLDAAMYRLAHIKCWDEPPPAAYHLVAANFFPWVTRAPWSELPNSLTEAMALHCWGLPDSPEMIAQLIEPIKPRPIVAFHGVNNAVPLLALRTIQSLSNNASVLFTDNLGYPPPPKNIATL